MEKKQDRAIGFELGMIHNLIRRSLNQRFSENGLEDLGGVQGPVIGYIYQNSQMQDVFQKDIEKWFKIRRSTATVMLQNMEQKGLIERVSVPNDGRLKKIVLTDKAKDRHIRVKDQIDRFHKELEEGISPAEKEEFLRILDQIRANLEKPD
ncbi:MAG: winged helix-turn-helix transcriptional regulator [Lachnospiraceae bacterium]|jgi:DNA-binding MarR family transcriptional regulator|nr:winged helix-turn-helix transcriptional regulator [Lachnospiraceae bacterium]MBR3508735.1 winged helix-turn-helix transcriptional regulator [Lachnospiraceae bacterium]MBR6149939.1 winged helix-turn-helix transcriptional regulator [Lachnospiraceae bacterium]